MKIVHFITSLGIGGAEMVLCRLLRGMDRSEFEPTVVTLSGGGPLEEELATMKIPLRSIGMEKRISFGSLSKLSQIMREVRPDVVQGWMCHGNLAAQLASWIVAPRPPVFWAIHNLFPSYRCEKPATSALIQLSALLSPRKTIFVSETSRSHYERIGYRKSRNCVIPNGIDTDAFAPSNRHRQSVRCELGLAQDTVLVGLMARFHPHKDHASFFRAARELANHRPDIHFLLAGSEVTSENPELAKLVGDSGLHARVHLLGQRRDMPRLMAALDVNVSSSKTEALSLSIMEAMACGVPCVVTDVGESAALVESTGLSVPAGDSSALANAMSYLVRMEPESRHSLGLKARDRIVESYSMAAMVRCYEELYRKRGGC